MEKKKTLILVAVLAVVLILAAVAYQFLRSTQGNDALPSAVQSSTSTQQEQAVQLPSFTIYDPQGQPVQSADFSGKPTVINFWATWCAYCKEELPDFQTAYETYGDRINFVMIDAVDGQRETVALGEAYIAENGYTFPVYFDTDMDAVLSCGVTGFPSTLFVSAQGEILFAWPGYLEGEQLDRLLASML